MISNARADIDRGCGRRKQGGVYVEVGLGVGGLPIEAFLVDPPLELTAAMQHDLGVKALGITLIEHNGVWNILDVVGKENYPNVADIIEEGIRFGFSRRCEGIDYSKLTSKSRLLLAHDHAIIDNCGEYFEAPCFDTAMHFKGSCPKKYPSHLALLTDYENCKDTQMCAGLWWQDVEGVEPLDEFRSGIRKLPAFQYTAASRSEGVEPQYRLGIFASLPITRLVGVQPQAEGKKKFEKKMANVRKAQIHVDEAAE